MRVVSCEVCGSTFRVTRKMAKFCSRACYYRHQRTFPNRGCFKLGVHINVGEDNPMWKGDNAGFISIHEWVSNHYGKESKCDVCQSTNAKLYDWANKLHTYRRVREDWMRLCRSCHMKYDYKMKFRSYNAEALEIGRLKYLLKLKEVIKSEHHKKSDP